MKRTLKTRAFTLIEMLVVISIVTLLISILLPSLGTARESARSARCMSNQKQLAVGVHYYLNNNRTFYPVGCGWANDTSRMNVTWGQAVAREIGIQGYVTETGWKVLPEYTQNVYTKSKPNNKLFICPSYTRDNYWGGAPSNTYSWNTTPYGMGDGDIWGAAGGSYSAQVWWDYYGRRKESQIRRPTTTVMFREFYTLTGGPILEYAPGYGGAATISDLHNGTSNVAWVDGHVSTAATPNTTFNTALFRYDQQ
jgi:prepilin-type processing-associated H-X9-DG protein/prepilin-type N-terminal cleavage/methylation domain-containing protein